LSRVRFCLYCRCDKPVEGFVELMDPVHRTKRGQCADCKKTRQLPRKRLQELAALDKESRRLANSAAARENAERKRKHDE